MLDPYRLVGIAYPHYSMHMVRHHYKQIRCGCEMLGNLPPDCLEDVTHIETFEEKVSAI